METNEKKALFTAVTEEECSTVSGGDSALAQLASLLGVTITTPVNNSASAGVTNDGTLVAGISSGSGSFSIALVTPLSASSVSSSGLGLGNLAIVNLTP